MFKFLISYQPRVTVVMLTSQSIKKEKVSVDPMIDVITLLQAFKVMNGSMGPSMASGGKKTLNSSAFLVTRRAKTRSPWGIGNFRIHFITGRRKCMRWLQLLHPTQFCPIYELHTTINIVGKSHTNSESHGNRWDLFCRRWCFNQVLQSINDLVTSVGR